jgi:hypothetical protein
LFFQNKKGGRAFRTAAMKTELSGSYETPVLLIYGVLTLSFFSWLQAQEKGGNRSPLVHE